MHRSRQSTNRQRRVLSGVGIAAILAIVLLGIYGWVQAGYATANAETAQAESTRAFNNAGTAQVESTRAFNNAATAQANAKIARAGELVALALSQRDRQFDLSLLLSVEAFRSADIGRTKGLLLDSLGTHQEWFWSLRQTTPISAVAFGPKNDILVSGSVDGTVLLWDWFNQQPVGRLPSDSDSSVDSIAFSPDGSILAIGKAGLITLWDVNSLQQTGQPMEAPISELIFSPDGKILVASSGEWGVVTLWDVESHQSIGQLGQPPMAEGAEELISAEERIWTAAFSPDGKTIISGGCKLEPNSQRCLGQIILWDIASLRPEAEIIDEENIGVVTNIAVSADGLTIAAGGYTYGSENNLIILWNASSLQMIGQAMDAGDRLSDRDLLAFRGDGVTLALVTETGTVVIWNIRSQEIIAQQRGELLSTASSLAFDENSPGYLAVGGCEEDISTGACNGKIILWSRNSSFPRWDHPDHDATGVAFSPDGRTLVWVSNGSTIGLLDRENFDRTELDAGPDSAEQVVYSPDGEIFASSGQDKVQLWDVQRQQILGSLPKREAEEISKIAFSPDGKTLVGAGCGKPDSNGGCTSSVILFWDVASRQAIGPPVDSDTGPAISIASSPDGKLLASGQENGRILLWDVASHQSVGQPIDVGGSALSVAFSPDGKILASGSDNGIISLWDVVSHEAIGQPLERYNDPIFTIAFSPDGKTLAAGSRDSIILWDLEDRQPIGQPLGVDGIVWGVVFSLDGKWLASASEEGPMTWNVDPQSWLERTCRRAARNLTRAEWATYFIGEEYRATCSQFPLEVEAPVTPSPTP